MAQLGIESVLVAGRGPAACAVISRVHPARGQGRRGALGGRAHRPARPAGRRRGAARPGAGRPSPTSPSTGSSRPPGAAASPPSCRCRRPWPATPAWPRPSPRPGSIWVGPDAEVLERLGGDGVEPASERGFLAWVTAEGPAVHAPPSPATGPPASPASRGRRSTPVELPRGGPPAGRGRLARSGHGRDRPRRRAGRGGRRLLPRHGRARARPRRRRRRARPAQRGGRRPGPAADGPRGPPSSSSCGRRLPPGTPGRVTGRLPGTGSAPGARRRTSSVVAVSGYDARRPARRLVRRAAGHGQRRRPGHRDGRARGVAALSRTGRRGVPHDGAEVLRRAGRGWPTGARCRAPLTRRAWMMIARSTAASRRRPGGGRGDPRGDGLQRLEGPRRARRRRSRRGTRW